jgi:hypothetical protein
MAEVEVVMVGQAGARTEVGAVATAVGQSAVVARFDAADALLGDAGAQVAAEWVRVRAGAVGGLGAAEAEGEVGSVAADTGRSGEDDPAARVSGPGGEAARAEAGSMSGVAGL